ncbi:hypothetical protein V6N13_062839 [Hibiscus sabdariffa]
MAMDPNSTEQEGHSRSVDNSFKHKRNPVSAPTRNRCEWNCPVYKANICFSTLVPLHGHSYLELSIQGLSLIFGHFPKAVGMALAKQEDGCSIEDALWQFVSKGTNSEYIFLPFYMASATHLLVAILPKWINLKRERKVANGRMSETSSGVWTKEILYEEKEQKHSCSNE